MGAEKKMDLVKRHRAGEHSRRREPKCPLCSGEHPAFTEIDEETAKL
jgi:hypothetical protein